METDEAQGFTALPGHGVRAEINGKTAIGGNAALIKSKGMLDADMKALGERLADEGKTPLYFAFDDRIAGIIAVADVVKEDSGQAISELKNMGIRTVMLTGDNRRTALSVAKQTGIDEVVSDVLPGDKAEVVEKLRIYG